MQDSPSLSQQLGRYRLISSLGQGGMGTIWLGVAGGLGEFRKLLVIKELRWDLTRNPRFVEMFLDEAKLAARLSHPNVVQTLEAGAEGHRYFLAMEFLDGQPLSAVMQRATAVAALSLPLRLRILCGALSGLHYAHELRGYDGTALDIVHRDISPHNVFVTYDGQVKVVDFGIAKAADADTLTQPGIFKGKLAYASPEQIDGRPVDRRADIFAMGVLLWELVTLQRFAKGKPTQLAFEARLAGAEPRLSEVAVEVEPLLCEICDRAMHVDPSKRFATAEDFRAAIEQFLFVSGERVDTPAIAAAMQAAFAQERMAMHQMIDSHLKEADCSESLVRQLRPVPASQVRAELTEQDPTAVADLSELVESSRSQVPVLTPSDALDTNWAWKQPLRPRTNTLWRVAGVVVLIALAFLATRAWLRDTHVRPTAQEPSLAAPSPEPLAQAPSGATPSSAMPSEAPPSETTPSALPQPLEPVRAEVRSRGVERAPEPSPEPSIEERSATTRPASAEQDAQAPRTHDRSLRHTAAIPGSMFGFVDLDDDEQPAAAATQGRAEEPPPLRITPSADSQAKAMDDAPREPAVGDDLRRLRQEPRRAIDLEDPFR